MKRGTLKRKSLSMRILSELQRIFADFKEVSSNEIVITYKIA